MRNRNCWVVDDVRHLSLACWPTMDGIANVDGSLNAEYSYIDGEEVVIQYSL